MSMPTLSVIMPNYNHGKFIGEALEAILSQSFRPLEVIVIDDASSDNSVEIINKFAKQDPIMRLIRNEKNIGAVHNAIKLLELARGDYVYGASADDKILPGYFEKSMHLLQQYPKAGLCCSDPIFFNGETGVISENRFNVTDKPCYFSPHILEGLIKKTPFWIAGNTSIVKREAFFEAGGYIPELKWHCDWFALLVIAFRYGICYIPEPLAAVRVLPNSYSASGTRQWKDQREVLNHMLSLLKSPAYNDVLPMFKRSEVLSTFDLIHRVIFSNPKYLAFLSIRLVRKALWDETLCKLSPITPTSVKRLYRSIRERK